MEPLKHECGVAMLRLLKPIHYYKEKYGTYNYALDKLYLLMEKQHNRGQEGAGVGVIKLKAPAGHEYVYRERALGANAITEIFANILPRVKDSETCMDSPDDIERFTPFIGEIYMGHLRYSTTGKSGISYVHPFLRRNNWRARNLLLCGNFNMTNVDSIFQSIVANGQHPRIYSDTVLILEQLGYALDCENSRLYKKHRDTMTEPALSQAIEAELDIATMLRSISPQWDGGFVICGATGSGDMFTLRDARGIRPAFYYKDDEIVVVTSERPVIQTVFDCKYSDIHELNPGEALIVNKSGQMLIERILPKIAPMKCSFERIYFSRGSDRDIYAERKKLGLQLTPQIMEAINEDLRHTVFSFIPNTAEVAFIGMIEGFEKLLDKKKCDEIYALNQHGMLSESALTQIMGQKLRVEKVAIKDIKLRTFITEDVTRNDMAAHVYDVTYGLIENDKDTLVVIDDSIVRGTTLKQSILRMLDRLHPRKIVVVSSCPQVRYPDYYGIDMSRMDEFIAFRAAVNLLKETNRCDIIDNAYQDCLYQLSLPPEQQTNCVKQIYETLTDKAICEKIAEMLTPPNTTAKIEIIYQTIDGLHKAIPNHLGDWYFSGNYPTPGGVKRVNEAFKNFYEANLLKK